MNELNEKLAKWAGLKDVQVFSDHSGAPSLIQFEESDRYEFTEPFTKSLDACFKWLVPKLKNWGERHLEEIYLYPEADGWLCELDMVQYGDRHSPESCKVCADRGKTPAMALCLAIENLIDGESRATVGVK